MRTPWHDFRPKHELPGPARKNRDQHSQLIFLKQHFVEPFQPDTPHLSVEGKFGVRCRRPAGVPSQVQGVCYAKNAPPWPAVLIRSLL